jgi:hypothetical protein
MLALPIGFEDIGVSEVALVCLSVATDLVPGSTESHRRATYRRDTGLSQFGPYINEDSRSVFLSPNSSENFTRSPTLVAATTRTLAF